MNVARRDGALVALYAAALALVLFRLSHDSLIVQDGDALMDMTRSFWLRGSFEIPNGLDVRDSLDLVLRQTTKVVPHHMYGKYPPLYSVLAAAPVGLLGVRGMYLLNAIALAAIVVLYHALAKQVLTRRLALGSTLLLPFVVPLVPYALMELPHLVSAAFVLGAVLAFLAAIRRDDAPRAFALAATSGLLAGFAFGVRLQNIAVGAALVALSALRARRRAATVGGQVLGQAACIAAMAVLNRERFQGLAPFSYGWNPIGPNPDTESTRYYFEHSAVLLATAYVIAIALAVRRTRRAAVSERIVTWAALTGALAIPALRHQLARMLTTTSVLLVSSTAFLHEAPTMTFGWMNKALLSSSPLLVLAFFAMALVAWRSVRIEIEAAAVISVGMILLLSLRNPDPATDESVIGFMSLSPRYLVDLFPLLLLMACWVVRDARLSSQFASAAIAFAIPLVVLFTHTKDDTDPSRRFVLGSLSLGIAVAVAALWCLHRVHLRTSGLAAALGVAVAYACVATTWGDARAIQEMTACNERWANRVEAATPDRFVLVGWDRAKDPVYAIRAHRDAVFVNAAVDDGPALLATLDAFRAQKRPIYYFGLGMDRVRPLVEPRYAVVAVLDDPLLWRLDPREP